MSIIKHFSEGNNDQEYEGLHSHWKEDQSKGLVGGGDTQEKDSRQWGGKSLEDFEEDKRILDEAKTSALIIDWFEVWCYKTKRNGGILVTSSIKEVLTDFYNDNVQPKTNEAFNMGVDAAMIEVLEKKRIYESIHRAHRQLPMLELFFDEIIVKLKKLYKDEPK